MRRLLIVPFAALSILLVAATCVANVEQRSGGSWTGDAVNQSGGIVHDVTVIARLRAPDGEVFSRTEVPVCPGTLLPGERGAFEASQIIVPTDTGWESDDMVPVFLPVTEQVEGDAPHRGDGLSAKVIGRDDVARTLDVQITNRLDVDVRDIRLCAIVREPDGSVASVSFGSGPSKTMQPGDSDLLTLTVSDLQNHVELYPSAIPACCVSDRTTSTSSKNSAFSVLLPPGWVYEPQQGIDSFVGAYVGDGVELTFDYGIYSDPLNYDDDAAYDVHEETIGGLTAKIVVPESGDGITGVHFADVGKFAFPGDNIAFDVRLTITANDLTPEQQEIALQIFRSIRFSQ